MQDIRKPYSRSRSNRELNNKVTEFEKHSYPRDTFEEDAEPAPISIPIKRSRRDIHSMEMYPRRRADDLERRDGSDRRDTITGARRRKGSAGTWIFILVVVALAVAAYLLTYVFNSSTITIVPKYQDIDVNKTITFSKEGSGVEGVSFIVATSSITKSKALPLSETKQVQAKAQGKVIIYNNYDTNPQRLIKNTRFESSSGKIYRINESVTVPGKTGSTPGSLEVTIYADSYGADYNSAPTDFTIPGFKGGPMYSAFFARSDGPISGGASGNVSLASLSDINAAKDALALELIAKVKDDLSGVKKDGYVGMYGAIDVIYEDNEAALLAGNTSTYEVTATGYLMLANNNELAKNLAQEIRDYPGDMVRLGYEDTLTFTRKDTDHINANDSLSILVEGKPRIIWVINQDDIKTLLAGKNRSEFEPLMKSNKSIEGAEIGFSPLWLTKFPADTSKIGVVESLPKR
ncbi:MAG: seg [Candidatus Nomurabacteria bacterium]|nr:seg [Candidatus Nomurabacteria bacterium]